MLESVACYHHSPKVTVLVLLLLLVVTLFLVISIHVQ